MPLNHLLRLHTLLAAIYALGLLLLPRVTVGLLSPDALGNVGTAITRLFGAALILITGITWGTSRLRDQEARRLITAALFVYAALGALITLVGQITATWNALGWANVVSYLIFVVGYGYFLFVKPENPSTGAYDRL